MVATRHQKSAGQKEGYQIGQEDGYSQGYFDGDRRGQQIGRKDGRDITTLQLESEIQVKDARIAELERELADQEVLCGPEVP